MVYTNRTDKYLTSQEPSATKNSASAGSKYPSSFGQETNSNTNSSSNAAANNSWSKNSSENDKWKYNNMVRDDRSKFNSMHFC